MALELIHCVSHANDPRCSVKKQLRHKDLPETHGANTHMQRLQRLSLPAGSLRKAGAAMPYCEAVATGRAAVCCQFIRKPRWNLPAVPEIKVPGQQR